MLSRQTSYHDSSMITLKIWVTKATSNTFSHTSTPTTLKRLRSPIQRFSVTSKSVVSFVVRCVLENIAYIPTFRLPWIPQSARPRAAIQTSTLLLQDSRRETHIRHRLSKRDLFDPAVDRLQHPRQADPPRRSNQTRSLSGQQQNHQRREEEGDPEGEGSGRWGLRQRGRLLWGKKLSNFKWQTFLNAIGSRLGEFRPFLTFRSILF